MRKVAIILPTYNEEKNIEVLIPQIFEEIKNPAISKIWDIEVIVVDSNSYDETKKTVLNLTKKYPQLHLLETKKEGLGKAYLEGFRYAIEKIKPYVIFEMDADLSHQAKEISFFLKKIEKGADFVIGSRYIKGGSIPKNWQLHRKIFSFLGNLVVKFGFMKPSINDWTSGYRAIKVWVIKNSLDYIKNYSGYVFQIALLDFALKNNALIAETPIQFEERKWGNSKINAFQYITQTFFYIFLNSSFIKFIIVGIVGFIIDFSISFLLIEFFQKPVWVSTLISTETAILSNFLLNNFWSFSYKKVKNNFNSYLKNLIKFNILSSGSIIIQALFIQICVFIFGKELWLLYKILVIILIIIPYSYFLYNKVIWRDNN